MLLAGDAEVDVRVDEGRQRQQALAVDDLGPSGARPRARLGELGDLAVADDDVADRVEVRRADRAARAPRITSSAALAVALTSEAAVSAPGAHAGCPIRGGSAGAGPLSGLARSVPVSSS